jgi:hypothetical protein
VLIVSGVLAILENHLIEAIGHPALIAAAPFAILATTITTIYQTEGNRALRASQLSNALGSGLGESIRPNYYNNSLPQDLVKLAATTLENTLFTKAILSKMAVKMRAKVAIYFVLLLVFSVSRSMPTGWLLVLAQTLFSADLVLKLIRLERFRVRSARVHKSLEQFFAQSGSAAKPNDLAILIGEFSDYECAKDEAAIPLDGKCFERMNSELSQEWRDLKARLNLT